MKQNLRIYRKRLLIVRKIIKRSISPSVLCSLTQIHRFYGVKELVKSYLKDPYF